MVHFPLRYQRRILVAAVFVLILVMAVYVAAPYLIKNYLNDNVLRDMGDYQGHVEDVDVNLLRGSYALRDVYMYRKEGNSEIPFFYVDSFFIALSWDALIEGEILVSARLVDPEVNFLDAEQEQNRQTGKGTNWLRVFEETLPTTLHELEISNGSITFQNFDTDPKVNVYARNIDARVTNLTNVKDRNGERVATADVNGIILENAPISASAEFDPFNFDDFLFASEVRKIALQHINDFAKAYGNIDFASGKGELFVELKAENGRLSGYIKPLFEDVNIMSWRQDVERQNDNPLQLAWEGVLGFFQALLTSPKTDKVATEVNIEGTISETEISSVQAFFGLIKNAFIDAVESNFEQVTSLTGDEENKKEDEES